MSRTVTLLLAGVVWCVFIAALTACLYWFVLMQLPPGSASDAARRSRHARRDNAKKGTR